MARLLLKAVRSLPEREQDEVIRALLGSVVRRDPTTWAGGARPVLLPELDPAQAGTGEGPVVVKQASAPMPVRLPEDLHTRLRRWATEHGFTMAAVVRGLIERFLDEQERRGSAGRPG